MIRRPILHRVESDYTAVPTQANECQSPETADEEENKIVTLTPEYDENTEFSGEVLGEVDQFRDEAEIKSYHTIDIDIPEDKPKEKTETKEKKEASQTPVHQFPNTEKPR